MEPKFENFKELLLQAMSDKRVYIQLKSLLKNDY